MIPNLIGCDAVTRLDEGHGSPADRRTAARFELLCQAADERRLARELAWERERYEAQAEETE